MIKETETKMIFEALKKVYRHIEEEAFSSGMPKSIKVRTYTAISDILIYNNIKILKYVSCETVKNFITITQ
jgi:hypothetical protein